MVILNKLKSLRELITDNSRLFCSIGVQSPVTVPPPGGTVCVFIRDKPRQLNIASHNYCLDVNYVR